MKKKIVLWGTDAEEKKILIALELLAQENKVNLLTFPEEIATESFYKLMMDKWRKNEEVVLPEGHKLEARDLSVTGDLLPEEIKVDRTDVIHTAKAEWHFVVLSSKMYEMYRSELEGFKEKIDELQSYDKSAWDELKTFWSKVQNQVMDRNLFREHSQELRKSTDKLFNRLKELRKGFEDEFAKVSSENMSGVAKKLDAIEAKLEKGLGLQPIFNQLRDLQKDFKDVKLTKDHRNVLWNRIDKAFKAVKAKRGQGDGGNNAILRIQKRYDGLLAAIKRMTHSINRDIGDKKFEDRKIGKAGNQLEMQLREAKLIMIQDRIASKEIKLADMNKTKAELEKRMAVEQKREAKRAEAAKIKEVKSELKEKIATEIKEKQESLEDDLQLKEAAEKIKATKRKPKKTIEKEQKAAIPPVEVKKEVKEEKEKAGVKKEAVSGDVVDAKEEAKVEIKEKAKEEVVKVKEEAKKEVKEIVTEAKEEVKAAIKSEEEE